MKYPRVVDVKVIREYNLLVTFNNRVKKMYDMLPMLNDKRFEKLKDKVIFSMVKVDARGHGISWDDEIDLSEYELWLNGKVMS